jgi:hypothetical protein
MDWWENCDVEVDNVGSFTLTCLPAQHATGRGFFDKMHSLWAGWSIEGPGKTSKVSLDLFHAVANRKPHTLLPGLVRRRYRILLGAEWSGRHGRLNALWWGLSNIQRDRRGVRRL